MNESKLARTGLVTIDELNNDYELKSFYVARYQRGYRWTSEEIESLLDDISSKKSDKLYCLQPLVVTKKSDKEWELIDGQQRMTTIHLIMSVLSNDYVNNGHESTYKLRYDTRESTEQFLNQISSGKIQVTNANNSDIHEIWNQHIGTFPSDNNIDNFHLLSALNTIQLWFEKSAINPIHFYKQLLHETAIIWYPIVISEPQSVEDIFLNLNSGKIKLTSAELIKALFILSIEQSESSWEARTFRKNELAQEWDGIEKALHNDELWFFINNSDKVGYHTRIGVLFDLLTGKKPENSDLFSYYQYAQKKVELNWKKLRSLFHKIEEWYNDIYHYHRIGFLINSGICSFKDIVSATDGMTKTEIKNYLENSIKTEFKKTRTLDGVVISRYHIENLDYEQKKLDCQRVLLLYNIVTIEQTFPGQRFPFNLYQQKNWTIEHIHPQNPKEIQNIREAKDWLEDYGERINESEDTEVQEKYHSIINTISTFADDSKISAALMEELKSFVDEIKDLIGLHGIGNLALLDGNTNSKIGNKKFLAKRKEILVISDSKNESEYIPLCTVNNFLKKNTSETNKIQMSFWSSKDSESYSKDISNKLKGYLPATKYNV